MLFSLAANMRSERSVLQGDRRSNDFVESRAEDGESVTGVRLRIFQPREARRRLKFWVGQLVGRLYGFLDCRGNLGRTTQPKQKQNMTKALKEAEESRNKWRIFRFFHLFVSQYKMKTIENKEIKRAFDTLNDFKLQRAFSHWSTKALLTGRASFQVREKCTSQLLNSFLH